MDKKAIFLFHGEDSYSSSQKLKLWQTGFVKKYGENATMEIFENKDLDIKNLATNLNTLPFLADKKLTIIKDLFAENPTEEQKKFISILEKLPDFAILIFYEKSQVAKSNTLLKKIAEIGEIEEFPNPTPLAAGKWLLARSQKENIKLNQLSANYLVEYCGNDLWHLSNELEKLKAYAIDNQITREMIELLAVPSLNASIFRFTDCIAEKNIKQAIKILETLTQNGEDLIRIFFMIVRHFRILIQVKDLLLQNENAFTITKKLQQKPFVIKKSIGQCKNFNLEKLKSLYGKMLKIDTDFKTGKIKTYQKDNTELILAIEKLIIDCGKI